MGMKNLKMKMMKKKMIEIPSGQQPVLQLVNLDWAMFAWV